MSKSEPSITEDELQSMREDELLSFIQETIQQLNSLGDRLETYAKERQPGSEGES